MGVSNKIRRNTCSMNHWVGRNQGGYYLYSLISIERILGILWFVQRVGFAPVPTHWIHGFLSLPLFGMLAIANSGTSDKPRLPFVWCSWGWVYFLIVLCYCNYARISWKIKRTVGRLVDGKGWSWNLSYTSYGGLQFWNVFRFFCLLTLVHKSSPPDVDHQVNTDPSLSDHRAINWSFGGLDPPIPETVWTCSLAEGLTTSPP